MSIHIEWLHAGTARAEVDVIDGERVLILSEDDAVAITGGKQEIEAMLYRALTVLQRDWEASHEITG